MGRPILKIKDKYFEWSTIVDAPVSFAMTRGKLEEYIQRKYGEEGVRELPERMARVEKTGHSYVVANYTIDDFIKINRAGPGESCINADQIYERYRDQESCDQYMKRG